MRPIKKHDKYRDLAHAQVIPGDTWEVVHDCYIMDLNNATMIIEQGDRFLIKSVDDHGVDILFWGQPFAMSFDEIIEFCKKIDG